jgi:beta-lactamase class A
MIMSVIANIVLFSKKEQTTDAIQLRQLFPLLSPRILIDNPNNTIINFLPLRKQLRSTISPWGEYFGVYFEYLPTGTSIGINEKLEFSIASLIKVPVAMAYFHLLERTGLDYGNIKVTLSEKNINRGFGDLWMRGVGATIQLDDAFRLMLVSSDDTAANIVAQNVPQEDFDAVLQGLDIDLTKRNGIVIISAKSYSSIFKALFFSSVLSKDRSQQILSMLTQSSFNDKLVAGIPKGIPVAHKIGVYGDLFQDCGVVYLPKRPYALCMFSQTSEDIARMRMSEISKLVYEYVAGVNNK